MNTPNRPKVFIEKIMPVELLNQQVYYENGGNPFKGLHRWYSRKPLSFSRASVLGSLLPADISMKEFEYLLGLYPEKEGLKPNPDTKLYKTPPGEFRIKKVQDLCEKVWGNRTPTVLDAFAGGGSIPFEAARYGLNVLASDLNPVAVVTMKAAMEYPLKFGPDLQQDIDKWVKWVGDEAEKRLAEFFPSLPGETVQNYLWAHTVVCPSCESVVPLSPNWWLSKTSNYAGKGKARKVTSDWCAVKPIPNPEKKRVDFELVKGQKGKGTTIIYRRDSNIERLGSRQDACPTGLNLDTVAQASSLQLPPSDVSFSLPPSNQPSNLLKNPQLKITKRRLPHWELNGSVYFITFNTWEKLELSEAARKVVLDACRFFDEQRYKIFTIVVMPDHVHWLIQPLQKSVDEFWSLSSIMHSIKSYSAKQIPKVMKHIGTVWQIEWYDRIIRDEKEFENTWEYIRQNPVKANLCEYPENYLFLWQLTDIVGQASSLQINKNYSSLPTIPSNLIDGSRQDLVNNSRQDLVNNSRQDACPTDANFNPAVGQASSLQINKKSSSLQTNSSLQTTEEEYNPDTTTTISRGVGKCPNCGSIIEDDVIKSQAQSGLFGHQLYAIAYKKGKGSLEFRIPNQFDVDGVKKANHYLQERLEDFSINQLIPDVDVIDGEKTRELIRYGITKWNKLFNPRQLLTLVTYVEIINEAKSKLQTEYEPEKAEAIITYLALVLDRCADKNCRLSHWQASRAFSQAASGQHSLNLMWCYPEISGNGELWHFCADAFASDYHQLCALFGTKPHSTGLPGIEKHDSKSIQIDLASADSLFYIPDNSIDAVITDPPYYSTIQYAELSDFFYVWQKRTLGNIFPELFLTELTDKDREAVANPSRFRNMGVSADELAKQDYEAKMALAFAEYYRVLRDDGVMTVQFNHKDSGAWDVLTKSLIDAGFEITASWAVSTENPQNLHQAKKNSVSSTVLLVCRKRDPNAAQAWWDDLRPEVANLVELRAPEFEANDITGIDLYLSAFGPALNVFSRSHPILDSSGEEVRPEQAFAEARKAIANYRFRKLVQSDTAGFDSLTQWYLLAWDAFKAREFPFDEARQLALAIGGFNLTDLAKTHKLLNSTSGTCQLLTPQQRLKKRAFSVNEQEFSALYLVDGIHAIIAIYQEEQNIQLVRRFMKNTGLVSNDIFMKTMEVAFKVLPETVLEQKALLDLWLAMDEIKAKVVVEQMELPFDVGQLSLDFGNH